MIHLIKEMQGGFSKNIDPKSAIELLKSPEGGEIVVLDVRTPEEFALGHLRGAVNIDYYSKDFAAKLAGLDKTRPYLVYCRTGNRSAEAVRIMRQIGFEQLFNLEGGILEWQEDVYLEQ